MTPQEVALDLVYMMCRLSLFIQHHAKSWCFAPRVGGFAALNQWFTRLNVAAIESRMREYGDCRQTSFRGRQ